MGQIRPPSPSAFQNDPNNDILVSQDDQQNQAPEFLSPSDQQPIAPAVIEQPKASPAEQKPALKKKSATKTELTDE